VKDLRDRMKLTTFSSGQIYIQCDVLMRYFSTDLVQKPLDAPDKEQYLGRSYPRDDRYDRNDRSYDKNRGFGY